MTRTFKVCGCGEEGGQSPQNIRPACRLLAPAAARPEVVRGWPVGQFCEAGLRFALCNLSRKKLREVAGSLPGRFLSRRCFALCITMEVKPRIAKQHKCHHCCSCKNYREKGTEGGEKKFFESFFG